MSASKINELNLDVIELKKLLETTQRQRVKDLLSINIRKIETEITNLKSKEETSTNVKTGINSNSSIAPKCYDVKINNYAWDQSDKFVKIFITMMNISSFDPANIFCNFTNRSMELNIKGFENRNYQLLIKNLLEEINVEKSNWKVRSDTIIINMAKKTEGQKWSHITANDKKSNEPKFTKKNDDEDPTGGLMDMMKKMYDEGDDELKRTIAKAWTESRDKSRNEK